MSLLQLPLGPLELFLEHGHLSAQVLSGSLVSLSLVRPRLVGIQTGLGLVKVGLGDIELTLERGDFLFLLEDGLLVLRVGNMRIAWADTDSSSGDVLKDGQVREQSGTHVLVGLFSLVGTLLCNINLGAELADFLQTDERTVIRLPSHAVICRTVTSSPP